MTHTASHIIIDFRFVPQGDQLPQSAEVTQASLVVPAGMDRGEVGKCVTRLLRKIDKLDED